MTDPAPPTSSNLDDSSQAVLDALIALTGRTNVRTYEAVSSQLSPEQLAATLLTIATTEPGEANAR
jgi:hypothetical protein